MSAPTLDKIWQDFREKQQLNRHPLDKQQALEYAYKCGAVAMILVFMDLKHFSQERAQGVINDMMNEFGEYLKDRISLQHANNILE